MTNQITPRSSFHQFHDPSEQWINQIDPAERAPDRPSFTRDDHITQEDLLKENLQRSLASLARAAPSVRDVWLREVRRDQIALQMHREFRIKQSTLKAF